MLTIQNYACLAWLQSSNRSFLKLKYSMIFKHITCPTKYNNNNKKKKNKIINNMISQLLQKMFNTWTCNTVSMGTLLSTTTNNEQ